MTDDEKTLHSVYLSGGVTSVSLDLTRQLTEAGHSVALWVEKSDEATQLRAVGGLPLYGDVTNEVIARDNLSIAEATVVINLTPLHYAAPPLVKQDWEAAAHRLKAETEALASAIAATETVELFIQMSYTFLYEDKSDPVGTDQPLRHSGVSAFVDAALAADQIAQDANACVLRVGYAFGDSSDDPIFDIEGRLRRTLTPSYFGPANATANWVHSSDLVQAILVAVESKAAGTAYNLTMDTPMSVYDFVVLLASKLGLSAPSTVPGPMGRTVVGKEVLALLKLSANASNNSAVEELGWQPNFRSLDEALEDVLLTWRTRA
jgi:nucleoside-diphosphate-sugar epimerase